MSEAIGSEASMKSRSLLVALLLPLLGACNMIVAETPMFADSDRATSLPRDGVWLSDEKGCDFDSGLPESSWPECAIWVVVRGAGNEVQLSDGKGQSESIGGLIASGEPLIMQARWVDTAKSPSQTFYGFYGLEPHQIGPDGRFSATSMWPVECGTQKDQNAEIEPFPGISPDCRASSKDAIRSAAKRSHRIEVISEWRWLRGEATATVD